MLLFVCMLTGCANNTTNIDRAINLRNKLLAANGCKFKANITADYMEFLHEFQLECQCDSTGNISFVVTEPITISDITGSISQKGGTITFDEQVLAFESIIEGNLSPVSAPWLFMEALRGGYIKACSAEEDSLYIQIDDTYGGNPISFEIWTNASDLLTHVDISTDGRRIMSIAVESFAIL